MSQKSDYGWFSSIRDDLMKSHHGEYAVIKDEKILGFYGSTTEALRETVKEHALGTFIVQRCVTVEEDTHYIMSPRVVAWDVQK